MSKITKHDAAYIIECIRRIRCCDEVQFDSKEGTEIQQRLELFINGITVNGDKEKGE